MQSVGIDVADVAFFRQRPYAEYTGFYEMVFTSVERAWCLARRDPAAGFAACFALKEAAVKALASCSSESELSHIAAPQIEADLHTPGAAPDLRLVSRRGEPAPGLGRICLHASFSVRGSLATAVVVAAAAAARAAAGSEEAGI